MTLPLPLPDAIGGVSQVALLVAVHVQPALEVMFTLADPPLAATEICCGETE